MEAPDKCDLEPLKGKRSSFTKAYKAELVALAERGEQSVSQIALDHQLNAVTANVILPKSAKVKIPTLGFDGRPNRFADSYIIREASAHFSWVGSGLGDSFGEYFYDSSVSQRWNIDLGDCQTPWHGSQNGATTFNQPDPATGLWSTSVARFAA